MNSCNFCPFFKYDSISHNAVCRKFLNDNGENSSNIIETKYAYEVYGFIQLPILEIPIPVWCKLPNNKEDADDTYSLNVLKDRYIIETCVNTSPELEITSDEKVLYKNNGILCTKAILNNKPYSFNSYTPSINNLISYLRYKK